MNSSLSKPHTYDDNEEDIASNWNSIHATDTSNSDDGNDIKISRVAIVPQNLRGNLNIKQMVLQYDGLEIIKVTKVKNRDIDVKASTNYEELIITLQHNAVANVCAENNQIHERVRAKLRTNEYEYLHEKMRY